MCSNITFAISRSDHARLIKGDKAKKKQPKNKNAGIFFTIIRVLINKALLICQGNISCHKSWRKHLL